MRDVIVVIGPGQIGQAIARRVGVGKHVLLADVRQDNANATAEVHLYYPSRRQLAPALAVLVNALRLREERSVVKHC